MGNVINSAGNEANASFTPDGKYLFFSSDGDIYRVLAKIIENLGRRNNNVKREMKKGKQEREIHT